MKPERSLFLHVSHVLPLPDRLRFASHRKISQQYLDMIVRAWGTWDLFQSLLRVLRAIGDRHGGLSIANVATRWVLDHPFVGAVLIGARLGLSEHPEDNQHAFGFQLNARDNQEIEEILEQSNSRRMITTIGDCGAEYRLI
jgi:diketogulonate reductase-like aldo/keto reductase